MNNARHVRRLVDGGPLAEPDGAARWINLDLATELADDRRSQRTRSRRPQRSQGDDASSSHGDLRDR